MDNQNINYIEYIISRFSQEMKVNLLNYLNEGGSIKDYPDLTCNIIDFRNLKNNTSYREAKETFSKKLVDVSTASMLEWFKSKEAEIDEFYLKRKSFDKSLEDMKNSIKNSDWGII